MSNNIDHKKVFYIDSRQRISGTDNNFTFKINLNQDDEFDSVCLLQAQIPKSYYLIRAGYNTFTLRENITNITVTIPPGNYSRRSFQTILQNQLNNSTLNALVYTISYPAKTQADTGKFTYTITNNLGSIPVSFIFTSNVFEQLGFDQNSTVNFVSNTLTSKNVIKLQKEDTLFLKSDICQNKEGNNTLCSIYCATGEASFSNIYYQMNNIESDSRDMVYSNSNIYTFWLVNESNQPIDLNGLNIVLSILCYKKNSISRLIKGFIKYYTLKLSS